MYRGDCENRANYLALLSGKVCILDKIKLNVKILVVGSYFLTLHKAQLFCVMYHDY